TTWSKQEWSRLNSRDHQVRASKRMTASDAVEAAGVVAGDLAGDFLGDVVALHEQLVGGQLGAGVGVAVVGAEHQRVGADLLDDGADVLVVLAGDEQATVRQHLLAV